MNSEEAVRMIQEEADRLEPVRTIYPDTEKAWQTVYREQNRLIEEMGYLEKELQDTKYNPYDWDLGRGLKSFFRRAIRKACRCILHPMSERQNAFNGRTAEAVELIRKSMDQQLKITDHLHERLLLQQEQIFLLRHMLAEAEREKSGSKGHGTGPSEEE